MQDARPPCPSEHVHLLLVQMHIGVSETPHDPGSKAPKQSVPGSQTLVVQYRSSVPGEGMCNDNARQYGNCILRRRRR
eukprot:2442999-Rhodomonas_salina.1